MARSGFKRGLVFYAIDLAGFLGSVLAAVRFHEIPGSFFDAIGIAPRTSTVVGGLAIFLPLILITAFVGGRLSKAMYAPGLFTANRVLGAAFAAALAAAIVIVGLLFARATSLPFGLSDLLDRSLIAPRILDGVTPIIGAMDDILGLELCDGRLLVAVPELCV